MLLNSLPTTTARLERIRSAEIPLIEARHTIPIPAADIDNAMQRTAVRPSRPLGDQIAHVNHNHILHRRHQHPLTRMPHLQPMLPRLLQEHRDTAKVRMRPRAELSRVLGEVRRIVQQLQIHDRLGREGFQYADIVSEADGEDLEQAVAETQHVLVVLRYGRAEGSVW